MVSIRDVVSSMKRLVMACAVAAWLAAVLVAQTPLTPIMNLGGRTDSNGALMLTAGVYSGTQGPLTPIGNLQGRADSNGYLLTTIAGGTATPDNVTVAAAGTIKWSTRTAMTSPADGILLLTNAAGTDFTRLDFGGTTTSFPALSRSGTRLSQVLGDGTSGGSLVASGALITQGSATGLTITNPGSIREQVYKVNVGPTAFVCAATTCDLTIGTLPNDNVQIVHVFAQLVTTFACTATCTSSTLSLLLGKGAGGAEYLASFDADAAAGIFGDADAEMGTLLTRAAAIQGGTFTGSTQAIVLRLTSGTGNIGNGSATNLSQGSIFIWVTTRVFS